MSTMERETRIALIVNAAHVRHALGQAAMYERGPNGEHIVTLHGQRFSGATLQEAIDQAKDIASE